MRGYMVNNLFNNTTNYPKCQQNFNKKCILILIYKLIYSMV